MAQGLGGILGNMFGMGQPAPLAQQPGTLGNPTQGMGLLGRLQYLQQNNPGALMALGSGMMQGNMAGGFAAAGDQMAQGREKLMEQQAQQNQQNKTKQWLVQNRGLSEQEADMAVSNPQILGTYLKSGDADQERFYGNPIPIEGPDGTLRMGQIGDRGTFRPLDIGEGNKLASPTKEIDIGTEYITVDRFGNELGRRRKENYQEAYDTGAGGAAAKRDAETQGEYESIVSKMPGLEAVVSELDKLSDEATYTPAGQMLDIGRRAVGMEPRDAAIARARYVAMVDNQVLPLLRDTFGAAFTQKEGETLRQTLGDPDKSPKEKQAVLKAFIEQKRRDVEALRQRTGGTIPAPAQGTRLRFNPATGELE